MRRRKSNIEEGRERGRDESGNRFIVSSILEGGTSLNPKNWGESVITLHQFLSLLSFSSLSWLQWIMNRVHLMMNQEKRKSEEEKREDLKDEVRNGRLRKREREKREKKEGGGGLEPPRILSQANHQTSYHFIQSHDQNSPLILLLPFSLSPL